MANETALAVAKIQVFFGYHLAAHFCHFASILGLGSKMVQQDNITMKQNECSEGRQQCFVIIL